MEYDVRGELKSCGGNGERVVSGLMRFGGMSFEDAVDSVRASGGQVGSSYVKMMENHLRKKG